ncbi:MAG: DHHA1 domain-containing protein, partial [Balneolaceae bacterium]
KKNVTAKVDVSRRKEIEKHHSVTHIMHAALRETLGTQVAQKGSLVAPDRLRFDFSHFEAVKPEELDIIESRVNEKIQENIPLLEQREVPIDEARKSGAMMLFGEKYGEKVRMITFDPNFSIELCGGTHVNATGEIGYFRFTNETSVAAGIRRVEAVAGKTADQFLREEKRTINRIQSIIGHQKDPETAIEELIQKTKELEKELKIVKQDQASGELNRILTNGIEIKGVQLLSGKIENTDMETLKQMGYDALQKQKEKSVIVLASVDHDEQKVLLLAAITDDLVREGLKAGNLVSTLGKIVGGGGGGQPNLATAGGRFPDKVDQALQTVSEWVQKEL